MWIYILNIILIIFYNFLIKNRKAYVIVCTIQCLLILALRSNTLGVDLIYYSKGFSYIKNLDFLDMLSRLHLLKSAELVYPFKYESGYVVLNWLVSHLGFSYHFLLIICATINMSVFGTLIYKYSKIPCLSFVIFCTFGTYIYFFGVLRQSLALSFFMISFMYALSGKYKKSIIMYFITFLFHRASLVLLPLLFLINKKALKKSNVVMILLLSIIFMLFSKNLVKIVQMVVNYFNGGSYIGGNFGINKLLIFLYLIMFIVIIFADFKKYEKDKIFNILIWALIFSIFLDIMGQYNEVWERSVQMYTSFLILLIPFVVNQYKKQKVVVLIDIIIVFSLVLYMINYLDGSEMIPYDVQEDELIFSNNVM